MTVDDAPARPPRPPLAFRVGVTGTRDFSHLAASAQAAMRAQITTVLTNVQAQVDDVVRSHEAQAVYRSTHPPCLRLLSPLAEGADRLVAEIAQEHGYKIEIALPFARSDYAEDFKTPESREAFDSWFTVGEGHEARPYLALDGGRGDFETASYEAVGRLVVRNCDLLIAIWDGRPARGRGGTGDIVRFAVRFGVPVWWIDAGGEASPRLVRTAADLRAPHAALEGANADAMLARRIRIVLTPAAHRRHSHSVIAGPLHQILGPPNSPLSDYLTDPPLPQNPFLRLYGWLFGILGGSSQVSRSKMAPAPEGPAVYWETLYKSADRAARDYADRYRSSYVWIFIAATLAVACATAGLAHTPWKLAATAVEVVFLMAILCLVAVNERRNWHGRWIACRLLAELCRRQAALAALAWSLPAPHLHQTLHAGDADADDADRERASPEIWVAWYFDAALRAAPLPQGDLCGSRIEDVRAYVRTALVGEQQAYHEDRRRRSHRAGLRLARFGELAFFVTLILVIGKLVLLVATEGPISHEAIVILGAIAAILPALSAALFGIRAYAELELLESQSARMERLMAVAGERIDRLDLSRPLATQDLAAEVLDVSSAMLLEVGGWADLFRVKAVETG